MPGRPSLGGPNLARHHYERLNFSFGMELPLEVAERTSYGSLVMDDAYGGTVTLYGKSYRIGGDSYTVSGFFKHDEEDRYLFNFVFIYEDYGRPPADIKPVDRLFALAVDSAPPTPVAVDFHATFAYSFADGWMSLPPLPLPLEDLWEPAEKISFNSIQSMSFSNIDDAGGIGETMEVRVTEAGLFVHELHLMRDKVIDRRLVQSLFREGASLSSEFIVRVDHLLDGIGELDKD